MRSTCEDVKKILGVETCKKSHEVYDLKTEKIIIDYSTENCQKAYLKKWNIPIGTVLSVIRIPKRPLLLKQLPVDLKFCEKSDLKSDLLNITDYYCENLGISISLYDGYVSQVTYTPTPRDLELLCKCKKH